MNRSALETGMREAPIAGVFTYRGSAQQLLISLLLLIVFVPIVDRLSHGREIFALLVSGVLLSALSVIGGSRYALAIGIPLLIPVVGGSLISFYAPHLVPLWCVMAAAAAFTFFVNFKLLHYVFHARHVDASVLCAGSSSYLLLGIHWALMYLIVDQWVAGGFAFHGAVVAGRELGRFEAFYLSYITLATIGYGDITPASDFTRTLAMLEGITGTFFVAVVIARLVTLYVSPPATIEGEMAKR